jgi:protein-L-isoaspartate O-methyltransferase
MMVPDLQAFQKISAAIETFEHDELLCLEDHFIERIRAIDFLEFEIGRDVDNSTDPERMSVIRRAQALQQQFDEANRKLFERLIASIRAHDRSLFKQFVRKAEANIARESDAGDVGYDELDVLVNGLLEAGFVPEESQPREPDMIYYQPTPARIVLRLLNELHATSDDVFYDLGSGLGHVPILVNLLADIRTRGVEVERSYFRYSMECVIKLRLPNVEFIHADARQAAYDDGTIFYMNTPFQGEILRHVLGKLQAQSERRPIKVCTYGPCTAPVSRQKWLKPVYQTGKGESHLGIFVAST